MNPTNQWVDLAKTVNYLKTAILALSVVVVSLIGVLGVQMLKPPVVVTVQEGKKTFHFGELKPVQIGKEEIQKKLEQFVSLRFQWEKLDPAKMIKDLQPLTTPEFNKKLYTSLMDLRDKKLQGKETKQSITNFDVQITKERVIAVFDKVLTVEKIPLVVPTQVSFNIIQGKQTVWNPEGLYIHGLIEHQEF